MDLAAPAAHNEDQRLIETVARGDERALVELYDRHASAMLGVAMRVLRDRQDAEDLVHDVFVEAWQKATSYTASRGTVRSWLLMRVRSRGIDRLRSLDAARRSAMASARDVAVCGPIVAAAWDTPDRARARAALNALPAEQRQLVELSYFEGMTCSEMAAHCDLPLGTVKSRIAAAMSKLRQALHAAGSDS